MTEKKKVLHIITGLNDGGAEGVLTRLCLHSYQFQHIVVSLMDAGKYGPILSASGVSVHCLNMNQGRFSLTKFFQLIRLIKKERPTVVQTWMYHADLLGGIAARLAGIRRVFWGVRHSTLEKGKSKRSTIVIARLCMTLSRWLPEKIICCASKALDVHAEIGYWKPKLTVIPNGYDLDRFQPSLDKGRSIRNELSIGENEFLVGKVGRFDPQKDHANLLQALSLLNSLEVKFRCLLVGKGLSPNNEELTKQIKDLGLTEDVILAGPRADIPAIMNALDLHVLSSSYGEAFPNVIAEAMACATPCVATIVGDSLEIIGDPASCCQANDPNALSQLIAKMAHEKQEKPQVWQARKVNCRKRIADKFSIQSMVDSFEAVWLAV